MAGARTSKLLLLVLVVALLGLAAVTSGLLGSAQAGKTITVGPSGCDFTTIQAAIDAAPNGSIIQVQTGSYKENLTIRNRDGLTLQGAGPDKVTLDGNGPQQKDITPGILILSSRNVTVTGFRITNCRRGLEADDSTLLFVEGNALEGNYLTGLYLLRSEARIAGNKIRETLRDVGTGGQGEGILVSGSSRVVLADSEITGNADCGLRAEIQTGQDPPVVTGSGNTIVGNRGGDLSGDVPTSLLPQPVPEGAQAQVNVPLDVPTIQAAVERVQSGGVIVVAAGTFQQPVQSGPVQIYKSLKIVGAGAGKTILQAPGPEWVAVNLATNGLEVTLEGLTVTGGRRGVQVNAGQDARLTLQDVTIEKNGTGKKNDFGVRIHGNVKVAILRTTIAQNEGIGLVAGGGAPEVTIQEGTVTGNRQIGIYAISACQLTATNVRITGTRTDLDAKYGDGALGTENANVSFQGCTISGSARFGIGLYANSKCTIAASTLADNTYRGLALYGSSTASVVDCTISGNIHQGVYAAETSKATLMNSRVTATKAESDGTYGDGVQVNESGEVSIQGCTISESARFGVVLYANSKCTIAASTLADNAYRGLGLYGSSTASVADSAIERNTQQGIYVGETSEATITNCRVVDSRPDSDGKFGDGIGVTGSGKLTVQGTTVSGSARFGVGLWDNAVCGVRDSTIQGNKRSGVLAAESAALTIGATTISRNAEAGVWVDGSAQVTATGATISNNQQGGIGVLRAAQAVIADCTLSWNLGVGVGAGGTCNVTLTNNRITGTLKGAAPYEGFGVGLAETCRATIRGNTITGNASHGICVGTGIQKEALNAELSSNTIQNNKGYGVYADSDSGIKVTGQGNTVSGNTKGQLGGTTSKFPKGFGGGK